jgi:hypothetical protein
MNQASPKLSSLQLELLKIYSFDPTEEELLKVKDILAQFFAYRFVEKVETAAQERGITDETLDEWLEEDGQ